jgi:aerobic carbon-monoxide dehydrogenase small subunit
VRQGLEPAESVGIEIEVNDEPRACTVPARRLLLDCLRDDLGLTGTHAGCEHGVCGACTILLDGEPVRSCLMLAVQADRRRVTTIEGLRTVERTSALLTAFAARHGLQCGFCTPGLLVTIAAADPGEYADDGAIRELISGNLCRCTGYQNIVQAVRQAWGRSDEDA